METATTYIPMDRRQALARGQTLPERTAGAALFADISGFTPLTEALALELGPKRGAEELTVHLNRVYDALIDALHSYGGSVIGFSGDAITCWLDGDDGRRATACGLAMQEAMRQFAEVRTFSGRVVSLSVKAAVATGPVRRFLVGDPDYLVVDTMAGRTLEQMVAAEHHAERGEVVLHEAVVAALGEGVEISRWRVSEDPDQGSARYGVVGALKIDVPQSPWPELPEDALDEAQRAWLLPPVYQRIQSGQGEFLAELRPAVALFLRFRGIQYDDDEGAPEKLDDFVRQVEHLLMRYDGSLIQITIGDKGSYLYGAFGAPVAHEDDAIRACATALELQELVSRLEYIEPVQIGITQGRMRTGAYGGTTRRTYGVLGDAVNLSARLMAAAEPGQILVSQPAREATGDAFRWQQMPDIRVKGKSEPVALWRLVGLRQQQAMHLQEPQYTLPMVGRAEELALIEEKITRVLEDNGQIVGITAEAGMGKSRLAAEAVRLAAERGLEGYGGECQSYGTNASYLVWESIWRSFFGLDARQSVAEQSEALERKLAAVDKSLLPRLPLLGAVLNISIPDSELTKSLDAKLRKSSLEALLVDCLRARARTRPLLFVLEDIHWLDPISHDLLSVIGRTIADLPVMILLVYRPPDTRRLQAPPVSRLPYFTEIALADFSDEESSQLIALKLRQFFGVDAAIPADFVANITKRASGNPFYIEEILNYLRDLDVNPADAKTLEDLDLPTSIYSLILSRVDQLTERQQATIRVASVIGRLFSAAMIWGVYPELGEPAQVRQDLQRLARLELTALDQPEPELVYLFKHVITQEVAYESLPYATRAVLHETIGHYIERTYPDTIDQYLNLLAFHFERSENQEKRRTYLVRAGEAAQADYANAAAMDYYRRALPLLSAAERVPVLLKLGQVLELTGQWEEADRVYGQMHSQAEEVGDALMLRHAYVALGELRRKQGQYAEASDWYDRAEAVAREGDDLRGVAKALICAGTLAIQQGDPEAGRARYEHSLAIRRQLNDQPHIANVLNNLGILARMKGDYDQARTYHEEALAIRRELRNRWAVAMSLNNLGNVALDQGQYAEARRFLEEAVALQREIGDKWAIANALNNLGNVAREQEDYEVAHSLYEESLTINQELDDRLAMAYLLEDIGSMAAARGRYDRALQLIGAASKVREAIRAPLSSSDQSKLDAVLAASRQALDDERQATAWVAGRSLPLEKAIDMALANNGTSESRQSGHLAGGAST